jgi:F0F1-type ATP synthase beta subunit
MPGGDADEGPEFTIIQREAGGRVRLLSTDPAGSVKAASKIRFKDHNAPKMSSDDILSGAIAALAPDVDTVPKVCETGIKVIDMLTPIPVTGCVGLTGLFGVGRAIMVMELHHRLADISGRLVMLYFVSGTEAGNLRTMIDREPNFPPDISGPIETAWLVTAQATNPDYAARHDRIDTALFFSPLQSCRDLYPAIDSLHSFSTLLDTDVVRPDHKSTAKRVIDVLRQARHLTFDRQFYEYVAMGAYTRARQYYKEGKSLRSSDNLSKEQQVIISRARKLELFFSQPFFTTESFTKVPGVSVALSDTLAGCTAILNGEVDDWPDESFAFTGNLEDIRKRVI